MPSLYFLLSSSSFLPTLLSYLQLPPSLPPLTTALTSFCLPSPSPHQCFCILSNLSLELPLHAFYIWNVVSVCFIFSQATVMGTISELYAEVFIRPLLCCFCPQTVFPVCKPNSHLKFIGNMWTFAMNENTRLRSMHKTKAITKSWWKIIAAWCIGIANMCWEYLVNLIVHILKLYNFKNSLKERQIYVYFTYLSLS